MSNTLGKKKLAPRQIATIAVTIVFFAFQMYLALVRQLTPMLQSPTHLVLALTLVFLYYPADYSYRKKVKKKAQEKGEEPDPVILNKRSWLNWLDIPCFAGIGYLLWYVVTQYARLRDFVSIQPVYAIDHICMVVAIVLLLIAVYRTLGGILAGFIALFILFSWTSPYLSGVFYTKAKPFAKMLKQFTVGMTMMEAGVFGTPLYTSANTLFYFIVFGAFFADCGGGQLLIDIGMKFSNKSTGASAGGPAKAAVISSGLMGMISGSAVANVATTGVMTIPMMKKVGYAPEEAGAVEAVASTGGQIMPPIMGVGAFIMAEMLGIPYLRVATAAILPAFAYYFAVFVLVDRLAIRNAKKFRQDVDATIKVEQKILPRLYLLIPAIVLVIYIVRGSSLMRSATMGIACCLLCNVVGYFMPERKNYVSLKGLASCCMQGAKQAAEIAIPTAACGIIINVVTMQTSLATNLSSLISQIGTNYLFVALLIAMVGCILLGMALPTVAAYLVAYILFVPCIRSLGIDALTANMFIFYFGIMAQITPPVCVASYTAAGIAGADAMKTGLKGFTFALVGFIAPFVFVYNPAILLEGAVPEIILGAAQMLAGTYMLAIVVAGYFRTNLRWFERIILLAAAIGMIAPEIISSIAGLVIGAALLFINFERSKKEAKTLAA